MILLHGAPGSEGIHTWHSAALSSAPALLFRWRIDIRPQHVAGNARQLLDRQHATGRHPLPLHYRLMTNARPRPCLCAGILFPRSSNGSSSTAPAPSVICSKQRRSFIRMTGKNRIRDETTARCTNDTRAFGFKTEQENPPTCMPAGGGRPTLGHDCASNPSDGMSKFKITVARIEVDARVEQDAQVRITFRIDRAPISFQVPILLSIRDFDDTEMVQAARSALHRTFVELAAQSQKWKLTSEDLRQLSSTSLRPKT